MYKNLEYTKGVEGGDAEAAEPINSEVYWDCLWACWSKRITEVEPVDTIMNAAKTRFFARAVADSIAIGNQSLNPANSEGD